MPSRLKSCPIDGARRKKVRYKLRDLNDLPTLRSGHFDNLKIEEEDEQGKFRVWLSRCSVEDGMPFDNAITVERQIGGVWQNTEMYAG